MCLRLPVEAGEFIYLFISLFFFFLFFLWAIPPFSLYHHEKSAGSCTGFTLCIPYNRYAFCLMYFTVPNILFLAQRLIPELHKQQEISGTLVTEILLR